jgi:hypothetical protein
MFESWLFFSTLCDLAVLIYEKTTKWLEKGLK